MANHPRALAPLLVLLTGILLSACSGGGNDDLRLQISTSEGEDAVLQVDEGAAITVGDGFATVQITVESVDGETVVISTDHPMAPRNPGGSINLNDLESEYTVTLDEPAEFATPTTDMGVGYTVTLERVG